MSCFRRRKSDEILVGPEVLRPLGSLERFEQALHSLDIYYGCAVTCRYAIPAALRGAQAEGALRERLERAVALAVLDHPLLQVGLVGGNTKQPVWVRLDRLDLRDHIQWQTIAVGGRGAGGSSSSSMDTALEEAIKAQHDTPFPDLETRPGWRMVLLRSPDLDYLEAVFAINHANADGASAKVFHETLLEKLNLLSAAAAAAAAGGQQPTTTTTTTKTKTTSDLLSSLEGQVLKLPPMTTSTFTPPHEGLVDLSLSPAWAASTALKQMLPPWLRSHPLRPLDWAPQRAVPVRTELRLVTVADDDRDDEGRSSLGRVLDACRRHDTTLTGLLQALVLTSLTMRTPKTGSSSSSSSPPPPPIVLGTPVSMRRFFRPGAVAHLPTQDPEKTMVNSVTYCFHRYYGRRLAALYDLAGHVVAAAQAQDDDDNNDDDKDAAAALLEDAVWKQAAAIRAQLAEKLAQGTHNDLTALLRFVPDFRGRVEGEMAAAAAERPRDVAVEVSNVGVISGSSSRSSGGEPQEEDKEEEEERERWTIERARFTQSGVPHGVALMVNPIAVKGKGLTIAFNWQGGLVDQGVAAGLAADVGAWLGSLGRGGRIAFTSSKAG